MASKDRIAHSNVRLVEDRWLGQQNLAERDCELGKNRAGLRFLQAAPGGDQRECRDGTAHSTSGDLRYRAQYRHVHDGTQ